MNRRFLAWFMLLTSLYFLWQLQRQKALLQDQENEKQAVLQELEEQKAREEASKRLAAAANNPNLELPAEQPLQYFTIGSYTPDEKRPLSITLTNRGAGVDRIELVERDEKGMFKYRSLDNRSGYPGYLAFHVVPEGLRIGNITEGSPAKFASSSDPSLPDGLHVGDILIGVAGVPVKSLNEYLAAIKAHDAGQSVRFTVLRPTNAEATLATARTSEPAFEYLSLSNHDEPKEARELTAQSKANPKGEVTRSEAANPPASASETSSAAEPTADPQAVAAQGEQTSTASDAPAPNGTATDSTKADAVAEVEQIDAPGEMQRLSFDVKLIEQPLDVIRNTNRYPAEQVNGNAQRTSLLTTLASIDGVNIKEGKRFIDGLDALLSRNWIAKPTADGTGVDFELPLRAFLAAQGIDADLTMVKSYRLPPFDATKADANYDFNYSVTIRNNSETPHEVSVRQEGLSGLTLEGWWYSVKQSSSFSAAGARDVIVARQEGPHELFTRPTIESAAKSNSTEKDVPILGPGDGESARNLRYIGIDSQYFVAAFLPPQSTRNGLYGVNRSAAMAVADVEGNDAIQAYKDVAMNVGFYFDSPTESVTADKPLLANYRIFAGPKQPEILDDYGLSDTIYYGWSIFGMVAKPLGWILHAFYMLVQNYGIAIMMLTVLVRSCMFPLSWRASVMGQRMQELAPELKKINDLYKDDMQKRGIETQKLYKKYKLNPMASCLPLFIQLPIFIGLYRAVSTDVKLRQQPLVPGWDWCSNLAGPDQFALWPSWMLEYFAGKGTGWFGPYINLLPILTCLLFIVQQKVLMPKATDEQTLMTQRVMMFMTVFMGVLFFKVPAGLCIYFITSSIWSLVERTVVKKILPQAKLVPVADFPIDPELPKAKQDSRLQTMANAKPPEKLSEILPWLKKQMQKPQATVPEEPQRPPRRKRKSK